MIVPTGIRVLYGLTGAWLALAAIRNAAFPQLDLAPLTNRFVHVAVLAVVAGLCAARAVLHRHERAGWAFVAAGISSWTFGELYFTSVLWTVDEVPMPSPADAGFLLAPALLLAGLLRIARDRNGRPTPSALADALIAGLAVAAVGAALVVSAVASAAPDDPAGVATALAYPLWDLVLAGTVIGIAAAAGWRLSRSWMLALAGIGLFWVADSLYLVKTANGTFTSPSWFDAGWWIGLFCLSAAAWLPGEARAPISRAAGLRAVAMPLSFGLLGLGLLVGGAAASGLNPLAITLAAASILAVMARLLLTFQSNLAMLATSQEEALVDALTGLGNRRAFGRALAAELPSGSVQDPVVLILFDLDGFKAYNDVFGHPAGDALLTRLGTALARRMDGRGTAFRLGGDEFCVLFRPAGGDLDALVAEAAGALCEHGEGFSITASFGVVTLPSEAGTPEEAMRVADQRMYAHKHSGRASASRQTKDVLLRVLAERDAKLDAHLQDVALLARAVARRLGLTEAEVEEVTHAAELHDIGKVAIPDAVLDKPGPLDDEEWELMRTHTLIGERIIASAPALHRVARLVRSSHERWDGGGYPDGLAAEDISLGARIIAAADAFDAMTADRSYRRAMPEADALAELERCAGAQFDPRVVDALRDVREPARALERA